MANAQLVYYYGLVASEGILLGSRKLLRVCGRGLSLGACRELLGNGGKRRDFSIVLENFTSPPLAWMRSESPRSLSTAFLR